MEKNGGMANGERRSAGEQGGTIGDNAMRAVGPKLVSNAHLNSRCRARDHLHNTWQCPHHVSHVQFDVLGTPTNAAPRDKFTIALPG